MEFYVDSREEEAIRWLKAMNMSLDDAVALCSEASGNHACPAMSSASEYFWSIETRLIMTVIFAFFTIIGVIGNLLVILVVFRVKGMITTTNCYLVSLAASDTLFFIATTPTELADLHVQTTSDFVFGAVGCKLFSYLPYLAINSSSLAITAFTIERFIGICHPIRARYMCTVSRAKWIIGIIWFTSLVYNSPWLFLVKVSEADHQCSFMLDRGSNFYRMIYAADFTLFYLVPMVANIVIYIRIALTLTSCSDRLKNSVKQISVNNDADHDNKIPPPGTTAPRDFAVAGRRQSTRGKNQVVKMLALVVAVFASFWLPYRAMVMYNSFATKPWSPDWYIFFSKTLIYINCAINPILYNLMSVRFRNAFKQLLKRAPSGFTPVDNLGDLPDRQRSPRPSAQALKQSPRPSLAHNTTITVMTQNGGESRHVRNSLPGHKENRAASDSLDAEAQRLIAFPKS